MKLLPCLLSSTLCVAALSAVAQPAPPSPPPNEPLNAPLSALPALDVLAYMGTWYQVAWYPNPLIFAAIASGVVCAAS